MTGDVHLDSPDTHHAGKQTLLRGAEREEPLATTSKRTTTGKCTGTDVVQRPVRTCRHSQLHLRRRLVHHVARKRLQQHRSITHVCPEHYMTTYYDTIQLRANPSKTHVCGFHLRNREAQRELRVVWNRTILSNTTPPVYLGAHVDRTMCYKTQIEKTNIKVNARNNIIRKLANMKRGCKASTLRPSCLALCYSAAEYACPVWARSTHSHKLNPALHDCCRIISGCLKLANLDRVHILSGVAPPHIRKTVACRMERTRQMTDARHQLFHHRPAASRLKSRKSFMRIVTPLDSSARSSRLRVWKDSLTDVPASVKMGLDVAESLPAGSGEDWFCWQTVMKRWGYLNDAQSVDCDCGEPQTMVHLLSCRLLDEACTADDLAIVVERAKACARKWEKIT